MSALLREQYERDGYCIARKLFSPDEMLDWKERIVRRMTDRGWDRDPSGVSVWKVDDDLDPFFGRELTGARIASVLADIGVGPEVEFLSVKPMFKNADVKFPSPWHHDRAYWGGSRKVSIWIALDDATPSNGCLKMVRGSHKIPIEMDSMRDEGGGSGGGFINRIDEAAATGLGLPVDTIEAARGDAVVFHDLTLHASHPNADGPDRWSFIATYRDATVPDSSTVWDRALPVAPAS